MPFASAAARFGRQDQHTEDKTRFPVAVIDRPCAQDMAASSSSKQQDGITGSPLYWPDGKTLPGRPIALKVAKDRDAALQFQHLSGCGHQFKLQVHPGGVQRASRSEPLVLCASRSGGVPPLLCRQPRRGGDCGAPPGIAGNVRGTPVRHNPSVKRSANGGPPAPGRWYAVHFHRPGPSGLPSSPG